MSYLMERNEDSPRLSLNHQLPICIMSHADIGFEIPPSKGWWKDFNMAKYYVYRYWNGGPPILTMWYCSNMAKDFNVLLQYHMAKTGDPPFQYRNT